LKLKKKLEAMIEDEVSDRSEKQGYTEWKAAFDNLNYSREAKQPPCFERTLSEFLYHACVVTYMKGDDAAGAISPDANAESKAFLGTFSDIIRK
jgi:hypothetical protein